MLNSADKINAAECSILLIQAADNIFVEIFCQKYYNIHNTHNKKFIIIIHLNMIILTLNIFDFISLIQ